LKPAILISLIPYCKSFI